MMMHRLNIIHYALRTTNQTIHMKDERWDLQTYVMDMSIEFVQRQHKCREVNEEQQL